MKKLLNKVFLSSTLVISLAVSIFNQGITQESKYTGQKSDNSKSVSGSENDAFSQIPEKFKWFEEAKFGLFIHWGLFSIPASMWNGVPASRTSEYIMMVKEIPGGPKDKRGNPAFDVKKELRFTTRPGKLYVHLFNWPNGTLEITGLKGKVNNAYFLADPDKKPLTFSQMGEKTTLTLPEQAPDAIDSVVCLEMNDN